MKAVLKYELDSIEKGVLTVLINGQPKRLMLKEDYFALKGIKKGKYAAISSLPQNSLTCIAGRNRFSIFVSLDGEVPAQIGDENGVFTVQILGEWRSVQFVTQYQQQHGIKSRQAVFQKMQYGIGGIGMGIFNRKQAKQKLIFVVIPQNSMPCN